MAFIVNEQKMTEDNIFKFEDRIQSKMSRFIDKNPSFVTYYHIDSNNSTVDGGLQDIEEVIGDDSPLKFHKIENFPIYGLEQIELSLSDEEQGLDTSYDSEAIIMSQTVKPLPNDLFILNHVGKRFVFRVTGISYDTIRPDGYYKISFKFEYLDDNKVSEINKQVGESFSCILENIGTDNECIIRNDYYIKIKKIKEIYNDIVATYLVLFYSDRHNSLISKSNVNNDRLFDPYQALFINKHRLFNNDNDYKTIYLSSQIQDDLIDLKYEKSVYRFIERKNLKLINNFYYTTYPARNNRNTTFYQWDEENIYIIDIPDKTCKNYCNNMYMFADEFIDIVMNNKETDNIYAELIKKYLRNEINNIDDIDNDFSSEIVTLNTTEEIFFYVPIILYILKTTIDNFLYREKNEDR